MSDRLQFFREQMAAFEGTSDPQKAIEKGYFIQQPRNSLASTIANRIALRPSSSHLLIGGIGSGKTTQLMMARDRINEIGDTHAVYVDASLYTDISEIQPGALIAIVGVVLSELTEDSKNKSIIQLKNYVEKQAYGYIEDISDFYQEQYIIEQQDSEYIFHTGILNKKIPGKKTFFNKEKWIETINKLYENQQQERNKKTVIIIDGLDRLNDVLLFSKLINDDIEVITEAGVGIVLVGCLTVIYSDYRASILQLFDNFYFQPCFNINSDREDRQFFKDIIKARTQENFIKESAINSLIDYSGGILRDLINLTQAAIEEAYMSDSEYVDISHVRSAVDSFARVRILSISREDLKIVEELCQQDNFSPKTEDDIKLLANQVILEYQYPEKRYVVHPMIKTLLQKTSI